MNVWWHLHQMGYAISNDATLTLALFFFKFSTIFNYIFFSFCFYLALKHIFGEYFLAMVEKWCKKVEALKLRQFR